MELKDLMYGKRKQCGKNKSVETGNKMEIKNDIVVKLKY